MNTIKNKKIEEGVSPSEGVEKVVEVGPVGLADVAEVPTQEVALRPYDGMVEVAKGIPVEIVVAEAKPEEGKGSDSELKLRKQLKRKRKRERKKQKLALARAARKDEEDREVSCLTDRLEASIVLDSTLEEEGSAKRFRGETQGIAIAGPSSEGVVSQTEGGRDEDGQTASQEVVGTVPKDSSSKEVDTRPSEGKRKRNRAKVSKLSREKADLIRKNLPLGQGEIPNPGKVRQQLNRAKGGKSTVVQKAGEHRGEGKAKAGGGVKPYSWAAANDLRMGVMDVSREGYLESEHLRAFRVALLSAVDSLPADAGDIGVNSVALEDGLITMRCVNQKSKAWLCETVKKMTNLWEGVNLRVDRVDVIKDIRRLMIFVPGEPVDKDIVLKRLRIQNSCVRDTSKWRVSRVQRYGDEASGGNILTVWCPAEDERAIKEAGSRLNCGIELAFVKFQADSGGMEKPIGRATGSQP